LPFGRRKATFIRLGARLAATNAVSSVCGFTPAPTFRSLPANRRVKMLADQRKAWLMAILASGTLDILSAFLFGGMAGVGPGQILRYVASGPFGDEMKQGGAAAAVLGLGVHYALMSVMVTVYFLVASRIEAVRRNWYFAGPAYGFIIYLVMYWVVVPARFGTEPSLDPWRVGNALFSHLICVGLPMAYIASRAGLRHEWART
jgi:hypothetical protein